MASARNLRLSARMFFLLSLVSFVLTTCLNQPREIWKERHGAPIVSLDYSPDGKSLATSGGLTVRVRDAATGRERFSLEHPVKAWRTRFSPNNERILTVAIDPPEDGISETRLWTNAGKPIATLTHGVNESIVAEFLPGGRRILTLAAEFKWDGKQQLRFWDMQGHPIGPAHEGKGLIFHLPVFSPDGRFVAYKARGSGLAIFDSQTGQEVKDFASAEYPAAFSPDSRLLAVRLANGGVSLLDTTDWQSKALLEYGRLARALNFSPQATPSSPKKIVWQWEARMAT